MLKSLSKEQRDCLERAEDCARKAAQALTKELRQDFLQLEKSYLNLARSYEFSARLRDFTREQKRRNGEWFGSAQFQFVAPIECEKCTRKAYVMHRTPDRSRPGFELQTFECHLCGHHMRRSVQS